ncbi:Protein kinase-like domain [Pseudocohnilembus persalinus]|uniref:Protein kinase-like domain n=1 Tax=Pseudocohnilembus persalinus TaxID=266149 RepID=A0A0V0QF33_PSEPJ|nr:Protein kinase-like domain [Pseudocohnilembus persalinus]|eukprot:KRX00809.1 Protein kinase-like domain [Pseudocohnilembus persalinus]
MNIHGQQSSQRISRPHFILTLIGKINSIEFNFMRQELMRAREFIQKQSRKKWDMQLSCQQCTEIEYADKQSSLKESYPGILEKEAYILADGHIYLDLKNFYHRYLKIKLGIMELNAFKSFDIKEVQGIIQQATFQNINNQLTQNEMKQFIYYKLFDDESNDIFSILLEINSMVQPNLIKILISLLDQGIQNDSKNKQLNFLEKEGFEINQEKKSFEGGIIDFQDLQELRHQIQLKNETNLEKINNKGVFYLSFIEQQQKSDDSFQLKIGITLQNSQIGEIKYDKQVYPLGKVLYGFDKLEKYLQTTQKQQLNLKIKEASTYKFQEEDFILENLKKFSFQPKKQNDEEYKMIKIRKQQQKELEEKKKREEEEALKKQAEIEQKKQEKEARRQIKEERRQRGEDVTDSSDSENLQEDSENENNNNINNNGKNFTIGQFAEQQEQQAKTQKLGGFQFGLSHTAGISKTTGAASKAQALTRSLTKGTSKMLTGTNKIDQSTVKTDQGTIGDEEEPDLDDITALPTFALMMKQQAKIEEQKVDLEEIDEEYEIEEENLKTLYVLGKGAFGSVTVVMDTTNQKRYAQKVFANVEEFVEERNLMQKLEQKMDGDFEDIGCKMEKYDNKSKTIYYDCGQCSLSELIQVRRKFKVEWFDREQEILYIAKELLKLFEVLFQKGIYHTDLKPANIVLNKLSGPDNVSKYYLKLIDFGSAQFDYSQIQYLTKEYYVPDIEKKLPIKSKDDREKFELYTVGRTLQALMLSSIWEKEGISDRAYFDNTEEGVEEAMIKLKAYYSEDLVEIVEMLLDLQPKSDIQSRIEELPSKYIFDKENLIQRIVFMKQQEAMQTQEQSDNIYDQLQQLWSAQLFERAQATVEKVKQEDLLKDIRLINWKIKLMKKIGQFKKGQDFSRKTFEESPKEFFEKIKQSEIPDEKWGYYQLKMHYAWTFGVTKRYKIMDEVFEEMKGVYEPDSLEMGKYYFQLVWLNLGDKRHEKVQENAKLAEDIYLKHFPDGMSIDYAEVLRYNAQSYYHQRNAEKSMEIYQKELEIRKQLQGEKSSEVGVVLNSIASIHGNLKGQYAKGYESIEEVLQIYYNTIGEKNQNCVIALDWKAWYFNKLNRKDDAKKLWEYTMVKAYQVFGNTYHVYRTIRDSHLWTIYTSRGNIPELINDAFIKVSKELYQIEDFQESYDYAFCGLEMLDRYRNYGVAANHGLYDIYKKNIEYRMKVANFKIDQEQQINNQKSMEIQKQVLEYITDENLDEKFKATCIYAKLLEKLMMRDEALLALKNYKENLPKLFEKLKNEMQEIDDLGKKNKSEENQEKEEKKEEKEEDEEEDGEEEESEKENDKKDNEEEEEEDEDELKDKLDNQIKNIEKKAENKKNELPLAEDGKEKNDLKKLEKQEEKDVTDSDSDKDSSFSDFEIEMNLSDTDEEDENNGENNVDENKKPQDKKKQKNQESQKMQNIRRQKNKELLNKFLQQQNFEGIKYLDDLVLNELENTHTFKKQIKQHQKNEKKLKAFFEEKRDYLNEEQQGRLQKIYEILKKEAKAFFDSNLEIFDYLFNIDSRSSEIYIREAKKYALTKQQISQIEARLLRFLEYKKQTVQIALQNKQIEIQESNTLTFDSINDQYGQYLCNNTVQRNIQSIMNNSEDHLYRVYQAQQHLDQSKDSEWAFKFTSGNFNFTAIGIAQKHKMEKQNYEIGEKIFKQGHGLYMISTNKFVFNSTDIEQNGVDIVPFTIQQSDIIVCKYVAAQQLLTFKKLNSKSPEFQIKLRLDKNQKYHVSVGIGRNIFDQITLISQLDKLDHYLLDKNLFLRTLLEQLVIMESQIGNNNKRYQKILYEFVQIVMGQGLYVEALKIIEKQVNFNCSDQQLKQAFKNKIKQCVIKIQDMEKVEIVSQND